MGRGYGAAFVVAIFLTSATLSLSSSSDSPLTSSNRDGEEEKFSKAGEEIKWLYEEWLVVHDKSYNELSEREQRFEIFKENLHLIEEHNRLKNNRSYTLGLNQFADLTYKEFASHYLNTYTNTTEQFIFSESNRYLYKDGEILPDFVDWRFSGAVALVKDQGRCSKFVR